MSSVIRGCAVRQVEVLEVDSGGPGSRSEEGRLRVPQTGSCNGAPWVGMLAWPDGDWG